MSTRDPRRAPRLLSPRKLAAEVARLRDELAPALPDVDAGDLVVILQSLMRPFGSGRRYFLRELRPGVYVF